MNRTMIILLIATICFSLSARTDSTSLPQDIENYYQAHNNIICFTTLEERQFIRNSNDIPLSLKNNSKRLAFVLEQLSILKTMTEHKNKKSNKIQSQNLKSLIPMSYAKIVEVSSKNVSTKSKKLVIKIKIAFCSLTEEEIEANIAHFNQNFNYKPASPMVSPQRFTLPPQKHTWYMAENDQWKKGGVFLQYL